MNDPGILEREERFKAAMLHSDVAVLDRLLADDLIFTNHLGQLMSKQDDLEAHRSGLVRISSIEQSELRTRPLGDAVVVSILSRIRGEFGGVESEALLRFTRVWQKRETVSWQVVAAHSSLVAGG